MVPDPDVVWSVFFRLMGLMMALAQAPLATQIRGLAGTRGITPCAPVLGKLRRDFGFARSFSFFPTVMWLAPSSDTLLVAMPVVGAALGVVAALGGEHASLCLLGAWALMLSTSSVCELPYPWDSLMLESGFLAALLPAPPALWAGGLGGVAPPAWLSFAFRLLVFRVLVGFGKLKFGESTSRDRTYIRSFLIGQPIPSPAGWWAHRLPAALFGPALLVMWIVEIPLPFLLFLSGWPRLVAAAGIAKLMVGIQVSGNFGYFNVLTCVLCVAMLDTAAAVWPSDLASPGAWWSGGQAAWQGLLCCSLLPLLLLLSPFFFMFNSWCNRAWQFWPAVASIAHPEANPVFRWLLRCARALAPWRLVASYGVFYPHSAPPLKWALVFEGSRDGKAWLPYRFRYYPTGSRSAPCFVAPWHPRLDHDVFYKALGMNNANFSSNIGIAHPYTLANVTPSQLICARLTERHSEVRKLFRDPPFPADDPPRFARARLRLLVPRPDALRGDNGMLDTEDGASPAGAVPPGVRAAEGFGDEDAWWLAWDVGVHSGPVEAGEAKQLWEDALPADPALAHPEMTHWRDWSPQLARMHAMWEAAAPAADASAQDVLGAAARVIAATSAVGEADVRAVFSEVVAPLAAAASAVGEAPLKRRWSWQGCWRAGDEWRRRVADPRRRRALQIAAGRLAELLTHQWREPYNQQALQRDKIRSRLPSVFDGWLFAHALLAQGEETFAWALTNADAALTAMADAREAEGSTLEEEGGYGTMHALTACFWDVVLRWHWRSLRMVGRVSSHPLDKRPNPVVPGFVRHMSIIQRMSQPPGAPIDPLPHCVYPEKAGDVWTVHFDDFAPGRKAE